MGKPGRPQVLESVDPAAGEAQLGLVGQQGVEFGKRVAGAACPAAPENLPSAVDQLQFLVTLRTVHIVSPFRKSCQ